MKYVPYFVIYVSIVVPMPDELSSCIFVACQIQTTMLKLTNQLADLEIGICQSTMIVEAERDLDERLKRSATARKQLIDAADSVSGELREHILKHNSANAGIISWIKPGASTNIFPEPIHLKEAMKYIMDNEEFDSNGYDLYDIYNEDVNVQYEKIITLLCNKERAVYAPVKRSKLSFPPYERLKTSFFPDGIANGIKTSKFVDAMAPILKTSAYMLEEVISGSIKVSQSEGKLSNFNFNFIYIYYTFIISDAV